MAIQGNWRWFPAAIVAVLTVSLNRGYTVMPTSSAQESSSIDCPYGPFETDIDKISQTLPRDAVPVRNHQDANSAVPIEISRIREGGISFFKGGLFNEGIMTWYAFDVERRLFIAVICSTDDRSTHVPSVEKLIDNQLLRYTDAAGYKRAEFVTVTEATPIQVREFSCLANKLLAVEPDNTSQPVPADVITKTFSLLHNGKSLYPAEGRERWKTEGKLARFISQPLQEPVMRAYER